MGTAESILIIILASTLSIFLITSIVVLVYMVKILKSVKRITSSAERVVDSAEAVGDVFKDASGKLAIFRLVRNIIDKAQVKKGK